MNQSLKQYMAEANAVIDIIAVHDAIVQWTEPEILFIDVRESIELQKKGVIPGSVHAPRGFLEFMADPAGPMHKTALASGKKLILYCATGGRSTLAAKTLKEMGIPHVFSMAGGLTAWKEAGGLVDDVESAAV